MNSSLDREDRNIRRLLIGAGVVVVLCFLGSVVALAAMVAVNFNFLNWME